MRKIVLTFGLIAGAVMSVMMLLAFQFQDAIGFDRGAIVGYASMVLAFLMVFVGVKTYRDTIAGGRIGFGAALRVALLISLVATCCYVATWQFVYSQMMPDFVDKYAAYALEQARAKGASEAELAATVQQMAEFKEQYKNPLVRIAYTFLEPLPVALLFSFVSSWIVSRSPRQGEATLAK